jgi:hypothetical protein
MVSYLSLSLPGPARASVMNITFWSFFGDGKLLRQMSEDRRASCTDDQDF